MFSLINRSEGTFLFAGALDWLMWDFVVVGAGHIGKEIAKFLSGRGNCLLVDRNLEALGGWNRCDVLHGSVESTPELPSMGALFITALPGSVALKTIERLLESGSRVIDVSFYKEDPTMLSGHIRNNALYVPDCGFAPGLSNIIAGHMVRHLGAESLDIFVGGIPVNPRKPFLHSVTWSVEGLIDEYVRPARLILKGKAVERDPLDETINYSADGIGALEGFYSDGLRTMLTTLGISSLREITLRYPGHLDLMRNLREMGFFDNGGNPGPRKVTESIFARYSDPRDICILDMFSGGREDHRVQIRDSGSPEMSSMARLTGHTAALVALSILDKPELRGLIPPEELASDRGMIQYVLDGLRKEGVSIKVSW